MIAYNKYPSNNFSISGIADPITFNDDYVYTDQYDGKPEWRGVNTIDVFVYFYGSEATFGDVTVPANTWYLYDDNEYGDVFYSATTNVANPWDVTSWLPITAHYAGADAGSLAFTLDPFEGRSIVVSGTTPKLSSTPDINGIYILGVNDFENTADGLRSERPYYVKYNNSSNSYCWDVIYYNGSSWIFYGSDCNGGFDTNEYTSTDDNYYPWEVEWTNAGNHYNGFPSIRVTNDVEQRDVNCTVSPTEAGSHRVRRLVSLGYV
jgi:hypothetical protein